MLRIFCMFFFAVCLVQTWELRAQDIPLPPSPLQSQADPAAVPDPPAEVKAEPTADPATPPPCPFNDEELQFLQDLIDGRIDARLAELLPVEVKKQLMELKAEFSAEAATKMLALLQEKGLIRQAPAAPATRSVQQYAAAPRQTVRYTQPPSSYRSNNYRQQQQFPLLRRMLGRR